RRSRRGPGRCEGCRTCRDLLSTLQCPAARADGNEGVSNTTSPAAAGVGCSGGCPGRRLGTRPRSGGGGEEGERAGAVVDEGEPAGIPLGGRQIGPLQRA